MDTDSRYRESSSDREVLDLPIDDFPSVSSAHQSAPPSIKRRRDSSNALIELPPTKRPKGDFNARYLNLLNQDIQDASAGLIHGEEDQRIGSTQIGEVMWSATEKSLFFSAVSCLGKHNAASISARMGTKSEPEVRQYLMLLEASQRRSNDKEGKAPRALPPADIPAAVEIGDECVAALEVAADDLALRQQVYEDEIEIKRWGSWWLITSPISGILEDFFLHWQQVNQSSVRPRRRRRRQTVYHDGEEQEKPPSSGVEREKRDGPMAVLPFLELFRVKKWLQLSNRVFMNSAVSESNWRLLSENDEEPSIRATAFADFHRLALSITKRLVLAAMYMMESRIRARSNNDSKIRAKPRIRIEDVAAAVSSLGMESNRSDFWARCARRLQLNVVDDSEDEDEEEDEEEDLADQEDEETRINDNDINIGDQENALAPPSQSKSNGVEENVEETEAESLDVMSYDEVEAALGYSAAQNARSKAENYDLDMSDTGEHVSSAGESDSDEGDYQAEPDDGFNEQNMKFEAGQLNPGSDNGLDLHAIAHDVEEAMMSVVPIEHPITEAAPARRTIESQIWAEHTLERKAEKLDSQASASAEAQLWEILRADNNPIAEEQTA